jgi:transposase
VAATLGTAGPETLRKWIRQARIGGGRRPGVSSEESSKVRRPRCEKAEIGRADETLKSASAFFASSSTGLSGRGMGTLAWQVGTTTWPLAPGSVQNPHQLR